LELSVIKLSSGIYAIGTVADMTTLLVCFRGVCGVGEFQAKC